MNQHKRVISKVAACLPFDREQNMSKSKTSTVVLTYHHVNRDVRHFSRPRGNAWHKHEESQNSLRHRKDLPQSQPCNVALLIYKLENCWSLVIWELPWLKVVRWWRNRILRVVIQVSLWSMLCNCFKSFIQEKQHMQCVGAKTLPAPP